MILGAAEGATGTWWLKLLPYAAAIAALIGACLWIDHHGYARGVAHVEARDAKLAARIDAARLVLVGRINAVSSDLAAAQRHQDQSFGDIRHDAAPVILRPIYRTVAVDSDGVGLLDRARAAADSGATGQPDGDAGAAPAVPAKP